MSDRTAPSYDTVTPRRIAAWIAEGEPDPDGWEHPAQFSERVGWLLEAHASDPLSDLVAEICRVAAAEELRNLVEQKSSLDPTGRHYVSTDVLLARATELDPEGAAR